MNKNPADWWDVSYNPITGCSPVSPGCDNCWAKTYHNRFHGGDFSVKFHVERLGMPLRWRKPRRVFVCSMGDLFHKDVPFTVVSRVFDNMFFDTGYIGGPQQHDYFILTKRPDRMAKYIEYDRANRGTNAWDSFGREGDASRHIHLGVSVENQATADERIPILMQTPAAKRFISVEPMLSRIEFRTPWLQKISWAVFGAESGLKRRPIPWADMIYSVNQCREAGVPVWVKQIGENPDGTGKVIKDLELFPPELRYRETER